MPTYDYHCATCGTDFEYSQKMSDPPLAHCPKESCPLEGKLKGTGTVERRISAGTGLVFKGSGFYITDYKGSSPPPKREGGSPKKDDPPAPAPPKKDV